MESFQFKYEKLLKDHLLMCIRLERQRIFLDSIIKYSKKNEHYKLQLILKEYQNSENNFIELQQINNKIHEDFYIKLANISNHKLSKLDLKYVTYIYLDMDNRQIADTLFVSINTVRVTKFRLKLKLGLSKHDDLSMFIRKL